jgi:hypothetical protein
VKVYVLISALYIDYSSCHVAELKLAQVGMLLTQIWDKPGLNLGWAIN